MTAVCLFCSASDDVPESFREAARAFGAGLAARGIAMVYGGSSRGLMGIAARAATAAGGRTIGVMPRHLIAREPLSADTQEIHLVETLAERKHRMAELSDLFVALPGGVGTLDEAIEMITWFDVGIAAKPTLFADIDGFWQPFAAMMARFAANGMLRPHLARAWSMHRDIDAVLAAIDRTLAPEEAGTERRVT